MMIYDLCLFITLMPIHVIIQWIFSFLFIGRELTTIPANNCLQISVATNNIKLMRN